jgi:hypothetical protein
MNEIEIQGARELGYVTLYPRDRTGPTRGPGALRTNGWTEIDGTRPASSVIPRPPVHEGPLGEAFVEPVGRKVVERSNTRSAIWNATAERSSGVGTATTRMLAARAAMTPAAESSKTRQRVGSMPSDDAAVRKTAGVRLAVRLGLGRVDRHESVGQSK